MDNLRPRLAQGGSLHRGRWRAKQRRSQWRPRRRRRWPPERKPSWRWEPRRWRQGRCRWNVRERLRRTRPTHRWYLWRSKVGRLVVRRCCWGTLACHYYRCQLRPITPFREEGHDKGVGEQLEDLQALLAKPRLLSDLDVQWLPLLRLNFSLCLGAPLAFFDIVFRGGVHVLHLLLLQALLLILRPTRGQTGGGAMPENRKCRDFVSLSLSLAHFHFLSPSLSVFLSFPFSTSQIHLAATSSSTSLCVSSLSLGFIFHASHSIWMEGLSGSISIFSFPHLHPKEEHDGCARVVGVLSRDEGGDNEAKQGGKYCHHC